MPAFLPQPVHADKPVALRPGIANPAGMWNEPYLETCCRSALHRLKLCGAPGRPAGLKDGPCLQRLQDMGLAQQRHDQRFEPTTAGLARHAREILHQDGE